MFEEQASVNLCQTAPEQDDQSVHCLTFHCFILMAEIRIFKLKYAYII